MQSYPIRPVSEFERAQFVQRIQEELGYLDELETELNEADEIQDSNHFNQMRQKAHVLKEHLLGELNNLEVDQALKVLTLDPKQMRTLSNKLKKRSVVPLNPKGAKNPLSNLNFKISEQIYRSEWGLKEGFQNIPITSEEEVFINR